MTPEEKQKEMENRLTSLAQKFLIYRKMHAEAKQPLDKGRYWNTMIQTKGQIMNVLFDMFLIDLESKLCQNQKNENTVGSQPQVVSDGGIVPAA